MWRRDANSTTTGVKKRTPVEGGLWHGGAGDRSTEFELARDAHGLVAAIAKQANVPLLEHGFGVRL
jgi:hypothetical protein